jgi:phosphoribosylformylglycinamidine (FGAM) synthase PurS component
MWLIEVGYKPQFKDAIGNAVKQDIKEDLLIDSIEDVKYVEAYALKADLSQQQVEKIAQELVSDPVTQNYRINAQVMDDFDWEISVSYHDDVTDNVGMTCEQGIKDLGLKLKEEDSVRTIRKYYVKGSLTEEQVKLICQGLLANELIESFEFKKK